MIGSICNFFLVNKKRYITQTLRGGAKFKLKLQTMNTSIHSGVGSGLVPDVFRILRELLDNIENPKTGLVDQDLIGHMPGSLYVAVEKAATLVGESIFVKSKCVLDRSSRSSLGVGFGSVWFPLICVLQRQQRFILIW